jgi:signal transduction histidine kinase
VLEYAQLLSLAAHEFRTPASVVGGYLRMLQKDEDLSERQRKMIDEAAKSCARLVALVAELSDIGKLDSNLTPFQGATFDLFADLQDVAANVHEGKDREVHLQLSGKSAGGMVHGDRSRMSTAFSAYFRALLREQPASATIVADRRVVHDGGRSSAIVVVARDGDVQRAYDAVSIPFDEKRGGIGLTLPIARRVIERHGGRVWAPAPVDAEDRGLRSAVIVSLPLAEQL